MRAERLSPLAQIEELLPLKGKWLRYFLAIGWLLLLVTWWFVGEHDLWGSFSTLFSADPRSIRSGSTWTWGLSCGAGMSLGGHTAMRLHLGLWELTWLAHDFVQSRQEQAVRVGLNLVTVVVSVCGLVHGKLQAIRRGDTGKSIRIGSSRRIVL